MSSFLNGNLSLLNTSLYSARISSLKIGVIVPSTTFLMIAVGFDCQEIENNAETMTLVSMTA